MIHSHVWIGENVQIGNNVKIQAFTFIPEGVEVEDDCFVGPHVCFTNDRNISLEGKKGWSKTVVGKGTRIGANSTIIAGITIGQEAFIAAGSVVTRNVERGSRVAGNPAKLMK